MKQKPASIWFKDEKTTRKLIPTSELGILTGRQWFDFDYSFIKPTDMDEYLRLFLHDPLKITSSLEIRFMNKSVGYGLFAVKKISKNTIVGFVSGEQRKMKVSNTFFKSLKPTDLIQSGTLLYNDDNDVYIIDSSKKSNHTHYIQHLPSSEELTELDFDHDSIATSNLEQQSLFYDGYDFTYFITCRDIQPGEIIGCPYLENNNERKMQDYRYFTVKGDVIKSLTHNHKTTNGMK